MTALVQLLPVLLGMAIGFTLRRLAVASQADGEFVFKLVFYVFIPALLFRTTARLDFATMPWRTIAAYFVPVVAVMLAVYGWQKVRGPATPAVPTVRAIAVAFGNTVQLGSPFSAALFGEAGLAIHIPLISLHALIILTLIQLKASSAGSAGEKAR